MKYQVGDRVKVRTDVNIGTPCVTPSMLGLAGREGTIVEVIRANRYRVESGDYMYIWPDEALERIKDETFKIFSNGPATICEKKNDTGKTVFKGIAKCCPEDHFNADEGAVWALGRVVGFDRMEKVVKEHKEKAIKIQQNKYKEGDFVIVTDPGQVYRGFMSLDKNMKPKQIFPFENKNLNPKKSIFKVKSHKVDLNHFSIGHLVIEDIQTGDVFVIGEPGVKPLDFNKLGALL